MCVVLKITVTVNHGRIHKKYPLPYHAETETVTEINVRERHGNGTEINVRERHGNGTEINVRERHGNGTEIEK